MERTKSYPLSGIELSPQEIKLHKILIETSKSVQNSNLVFPNGLVFIIAGGYGRDKVSFVVIEC